jgi:hypothetical protein
MGAGGASDDYNGLTTFCFFGPIYVPAAEPQFEAGIVMAGRLLA